MSISLAELIKIPITKLRLPERAIDRSFGSPAFNRNGLAMSRGKRYLSMGCVKDDDITITWDSKAMEQGR